MVYWSRGRFRIALLMVTGGGGSSLPAAGAGALCGGPVSGGGDGAGEVCGGAGVCGAAGSTTPLSEKVSLSKTAELRADAAAAVAVGLTMAPMKRASAAQQADGTNGRASLVDKHPKGQYTRA